MRLGIIVILVGALFLLRNMGILDTISWGILWPIIVILVGLVFILKNEYGYKRFRRPSMGAYSKSCSCDCEDCKNCKK